jgi:hypothetical protein
VTPNHPLTTKDIFLVSIVTLLPPDWLSCVLFLMNETHVSPSRIINALKQEDLRRKAWVEDLSVPESVSTTSAACWNEQNGSQPKRQKGSSPSLKKQTKRG